MKRFKIRRMDVIPCPKLGRIVPAQHFSGTNPGEPVCVKCEYFAKKTCSTVTCNYTATEYNEKMV